MQARSPSGPILLTCAGDSGLLGANLTHAAQHTPHACRTHAACCTPHNAHCTPYTHTTRTPHACRPQHTTRRTPHAHRTHAACTPQTIHCTLHAACCTPSACRTHTTRIRHAARTLHAACTHAMRSTARRTPFCYCCAENRGRRQEGRRPINNSNAWHCE